MVVLRGSVASPKTSRERKSFSTPKIKENTPFYSKNVVTIT